MIRHFCTGGKMTPSHLFKSASLQPLLLKTKGWFLKPRMACLPMGGGIDFCGATPFFPLGTPKQRNPRALRHRIPIWSRAFLRSWNNLFTPISPKGFKRVVLQC